MSPEYLYVGIKGRVLAVNRDTGVIAWEARLKGSQMVTIHVDGDRLFAATKGEIFCLNPVSGGQLWQNSLPGMGLDLICLATSRGNNNASLLQQGRRRQQEEASS